jgi:hypothetical protein
MFLANDFVAVDLHVVSPCRMVIITFLLIIVEGYEKQFILLFILPPSRGSGHSY